MMDSILQYRKDNNMFQRSIDERSEQLNFRFFDWPPFASWDPHYGHLLAWAIKDVFPRYMTMRGFRVERKRWWDCHGLPVEKAVEKKLWIDWKRDIENKIWVETFAEECRKYVDNTNENWKWFVDHSWRRADIEHPYRTMDLDFMESVMYCFSNIYRQNLVYKGFKVQRYCPSCATPLANNEVSDWYEDKTDTAITVRFKLNNKANAKRLEYEHTSNDEAINVVCCVIKKDWKYLLEFWVKAQKYVFPGGKVEKWDSIEKTVAKEIKEELDVEVKSSKILWEFKEVLRWNIWNLIYVETEIEWEPKIMEPDKITQLVRAEIIESENELWMAVNIDWTIMEDPEEIISQFYDLYVQHNQFAGNIQPDAPVYALAWTTTPWTLPSNSFLAVWPEIYYCMVYDKESNEYYILAESLLKKYFKNSEDYLLINKIKGEKLVWTFYEPLFPYINNSNMAPEFKEQYFHIIPADYVSTEDGTGIVHIAPTFWVEDFDAVAKVLWADRALDWLFMPVNEYWEFDEQVPDYKWQSVLTVNKWIIERLKSEKKLIKSESITHSYPHCRRCHTPLISKAMSSRFIKEQQMNAKTISDAEKIRFIPESVSNRFVNWLKQAPDWNVARNRYRWSPLPIRENVENPLDTISLWTLDELYQFTRSWSKNLTKFVFARHWKTDCNITRTQDPRWDLAHLTDEWKQQAEIIKQQLNNLKSDYPIIILSPMERTWETALPLLNERYSADEISNIRAKYDELQKEFREIRDNGNIIEYLANQDNELLFDLWNNVRGDFRASEFQQISVQWKATPKWTHTQIPTSQPSFDAWDECVDQVRTRTTNMVHDLAQKFPTQTILVFSHGDPIYWMRSAFRKLSYSHDKAKYYPKNWDLVTHYRDNTRNTEVDLHKPYVDSYRGMEDWKTYKRIPEVMDCWFESGAMPFGQDHYIGQKEKENQNFTAEFIAEWLDQTRWWFRSLHILNHAIKGNNAANNIVVNGLVLAEDWKKMSKSLKNYPDPRGLIEQRWWDAFRLYTLSAPVVRAEPMRFSEKWVEQAFKDSIMPLQNVFNFFETYAKIDQWKNNWKYFFALRNDSEVSESNRQFIEKLIRTNPDIIISEDNNYAESIKDLINKYTVNNHEITIQKADLSNYLELVNSFNWKRVLILASENEIKSICESIFWKVQKNLNKSEILPLPTYQLNNDLDAWLLSELHQTIFKVDELLQWYVLDEATKTALEFLDKLTNWRLRRSRRRFRANGMDADKHAAYSTLFTVLKTYLQVLAPFVPFVTENLWQKLAEFSEEKTDSIHLSYRPLASELYISKDLMEEIAQVRKIIKLALFVRAKNKIAIKQPLQKLEVKME